MKAYEPPSGLDARYGTWTAPQLRGDVNPDHVEAAVDALGPAHGASKRLTTAAEVAATRSRSRRLPNCLPTCLLIRPLLSRAARWRTREAKSSFTRRIADASPPPQRWPGVHKGLVVKRQ